MLTQQEFRDKLLSYNNYSAKSKDPSIAAATRQLLLPHDTDAFAKMYLSGNVSTCALFSMAVLRLWGFAAKELDKPYASEIGTAISNVVAIGKRYNAWISDTDGLNAFPEVGDIILLGPLEHVLNVIDVGSFNDSDPKIAANGIIRSQDGGQVDGSYILTKNRIMVTYNGKQYLVDPAKPYNTNGTPNGRMIEGRLSAQKLATNLGVNFT